MDPVANMEDEYQSDDQRIADWCNVGEWTACDAAYILMNLDPHWTASPTETQGWSCSWICRDPDLLTADELAFQNPLDAAAEYGRDRNLSMELERMLRFTGAANPLEVRSPRDWIAWARSYDLLPQWLAAYAKLSLRNVDQLRATELNKVSQAGGRARHARSPLGRVKPQIVEDIDRWLESEPTESGATFAGRLLDRFGKLSESQADPPKLAELETILKWIGQRRKAKRAQSARAG